MDYLYSDLFLNSEDSDFEAHVETLNETRLAFPVHGFVLERGSEVFKTMMQKDRFKEGTTKILEIKVPGDEEDAITFFRYLYTRKLGSLDIPSYIALMKLAHLYEVKRLFESCASRLKESVTPYSVCHVYLSLEKVATEDFLLFCKNLMLEYAFIIFMENLHTILNENTMKFLLESNRLTLLDEEQALCATWVWARTNCLCETKITEETFKGSFDKLKSFIRWSKITNAMDAPWFHFVEENQKLCGTNEEDRYSFCWYTFSRRFSKILDGVDLGEQRSFQYLQRRFERQDFWALDLLFNPGNNDFEAHVEMQNNGKMVVIPVHGFILRRASNHFKAIMEKDQFTEGEIKVINIKIPGDQVNVEAFFRYLYTMKLSNLDIRSYITLMQVAHLYEVGSLLELCEKRIVEVLTPYSVCRVYRSLEKIVSENTLMFCKDIMLRFAFILFVENFHLVLKEETMKFLLESNELNLINEEQALSALWWWTRTNSLLESSLSKEIVEDTLDKFLYLVRWSVINNTEMYAPWVNLMRDNKDLLGNETKARVTYNKILLNRYSNVLVFSENDDFKETVSLVREQVMVDINTSFDVLLTGLTIILKRNRFFPLKLMVNNNDITSNITINEQTIIQEIINKESWIVSRMTFEFRKPIVLSSLHSNKIIISLEGGVIFPSYNGKSDKKYITDSGRALEVHVSGRVIGIQKLYYMMWK